MRQLVLDIRPDAPPSFANFIADGNQALLAALTPGPQPSIGHLYLWGEAGCGRSHLLRAAAGATTGHYLQAETINAPLPETPGLLLAVDDVDRLSEEAQIHLFNGFNRAGRLGQRLVLAGPSAPLGLALREDLRTRIGQCLTYQVHPLDDEARTAILTHQAACRGLRLEADVANHLLRFGRRDLPNLLKVLDALDQASLERKRPITLPLLRDLIQGGLEI